MIYGAGSLGETMRAHCVWRGGFLIDELVCSDDDEPMVMTPAEAAAVCRRAVPDASTDELFDALCLYLRILATQRPAQEETAAEPRHAPPAAQDVDAAGRVLEAAGITTRCNGEFTLRVVTDPPGRQAVQSVSIEFAHAAVLSGYRAAALGQFNGAARELFFRGSPGARWRRRSCEGRIRLVAVEHGTGDAVPCSAGALSETPWDEPYGPLTSLPLPSERCRFPGAGLPGLDGGRSPDEPLMLSALEVGALLASSSNPGISATTIMQAVVLWQLVHEDAGGRTGATDCTIRSLAERLAVRLEYASTSDVRARTRSLLGHLASAGLLQRRESARGLLLHRPANVPGVEALERWGRDVGSYWSRFEPATCALLRATRRASHALSEDLRTDWAAVLSSGRCRVIVG